MIIFKVNKLIRVRCNVIIISFVVVSEIIKSTLDYLCFIELDFVGGFMVFEGIESNNL